MDEKENQPKRCPCPQCGLRSVRAKKEAWAHLDVAYGHDEAHFAISLRVDMEGVVTEAGVLWNQRKRTSTANQVRWLPKWLSISPARSSTWTS